jgi:hypothetical protein
MESKLNLNPKTILMNALISSFGLKKYSMIKNEYLKHDITKNLDFQRQFNSFFVFRRNQFWRESFYAFFETHKIDKTLKFEKILYYFMKKLEILNHHFPRKC